MRATHEHARSKPIELVQRIFFLKLFLKFLLFIFFLGVKRICRKTLFLKQELPQLTLFFVSLITTHGEQ